MIKAAIFDMDGLLIDSEHIAHKAFEDIVEPLGVKPTAEDWVKVQGSGYKPSVEYFHRTYGWQGKTTVDEVTDEILAEMEKLIQSDCSLLPGVEHAIKVCQEAGLKLAVASSSPQKLIDTMVDTFNLNNDFHLLYSGTNEPFNKPHPGVFISVAQKLGIDPRDCVVFEDSPSGVLAAKAARMHCIAVPHVDHKDHAFIQTADYVLDSLEQFDVSMLV